MIERSCKGNLKLPKQQDIRDLFFSRRLIEYAPHVGMFAVGNRPETNDFAICRKSHCKRPSFSV